MEAIRAAIGSAGGAIPFSEFQRLALYGPNGFYTRPDGGRAGRRRGDFITSSEVGPLFGVVLARYLDDVWRTLGEPSPFVVVDAGAGPGTLARTIAAAAPACARSDASTSRSRSRPPNATATRRVSSRRPSYPTDRSTA